MQQQLSQLHVLHRRLPDGWKPILHQQFQNVPDVPLVGPLLARSRSMNRAGVPQQKLMTQLIHQPLKPAKVPRCLHADTHIPSRQRTVKLLRLPGVAQTALTILPRFLHYVRNLLKTGMKITSYNHHARLLSSRASVRGAATSLLRSREPTLSCNQFSTFDHSNSDFAVIQAYWRECRICSSLKGRSERPMPWSCILSRKGRDIAYPPKKRNSHSLTVQPWKRVCGFNRLQEIGLAS